MERLENNLAKLRTLLAEQFNKDKTGHSADHLERTLAYALKLWKAEGGNKMVIAISAYVHDVHRLIGANEGRFCTPEESLPTVREILEKLDLTKEEIEHTHQLLLSTLPM